MSHNTDFLYARPSAVEGVARLLDFGNCLNEYNRSATTEQADARALRAGGLFTLTTRFGDFDLLADPDPGLDYETLERTAVRARVHGVSVLVASLDDLIAMKRAAGRPKDRIELEILGALREEIDQAGRPPGGRLSG